MLDVVTLVTRTFEREFWPIAGRFDIMVLRGPEAWTSQDPRVARPGVYVWGDGAGVIKVGRHFTNARKRALEHVRDDTGAGTDLGMARLEADPNAVLILLTVEAADMHWVAAAEVYLEMKLEPGVRSKRTA
jgi:hypothetical protein